MTNKKDKLIEVARSFSYKLNTGNYQSVDFFCSRKEECAEEEAGEVSQKLYDFCKAEVMLAVYDFKQELADPMLEIKESIKRNPTPTVVQWESMTAEEQSFRKAVDLKRKRREDYQRRHPNENKEIAVQEAELDVDVSE